MDQLIDAGLENSIAAKKALVASQREEIKTLVHWLVETLRGDGKILLFGNGGSAADAQHLAAEFVNRFLIERRPLAALALTTDTSVITSIGNDYSFDEIFSKQIAALGRPGDLALGISTSGNSPNVIRAIEQARLLGIRTVVLTGGDGGKLLGLADLAINVPVRSTPAIQEAHLWLEHLLCQLVDEVLFGRYA